VIRGYLREWEPLGLFGDALDLAGFLAGFALPATGGGLADECFGRALSMPLLTSALSSSAAFGMADAVALAQQNAAATMTVVTLRVRVFICSFQFHL